VHYMLQILNHLGAEVERASGVVVTVKAEKVSTVAPYEVVRKMRASVLCSGSAFRERERGDCLATWWGALSETGRSIFTCAVLNLWEQPSGFMQAIIKVSSRPQLRRCEYFPQRQVWLNCAWY